MKRSTFNTLFFIRRTRLSKNGEAPILLRITVNGTRADCNTQLKVNPDQWNSIAGKSIDRDRKAAELNHHLDSIKVRVMQIHREMEIDGQRFIAQTVINKYQGKDAKPQIMLIEVFQEHNDRCRKLSIADMSPATVDRYETSLKHTVEFIQYNFSKSDIPIEDVNHKFITDYEFYLKTERKCAHNTATKYLKNFKKIIRIALANEYITKDPFANIKFTLDKVNRDFLSETELRTIIQKEFDIDRLSQIRDFFVFSCFTGLAFSGLKGLKKEHIVYDNDNRPWIRKQRQKTKIMCDIPILEIPNIIMDKYKEHPACCENGGVLPVGSNTKMNAYLKEIMDLCGVKKLVSTHTARHTFATYMLSKGVSIENVSKMLGHTDTKMTRHYARILDESIMSDMISVGDQLNFSKAT